MANVIAVKQRRTYKMVDGKKEKVPPPSAANLAHSTGVTTATYWLNDGKNISVSKRIESRKEANEVWKKWEDEARERYIRNHKRKQKPPSNTTLIEEMIIIFGTDIKLSKEEQIEYLQEYAKAFKRKYNTEVLHIALHDHEGHIDEDGNERINLHAHIFFSNIDNNGKSVRRQWNRNELSQMQTDAYLIGRRMGFDIDMTQKPLLEKPRKGLGHRAYRAKREKEEKQRVKELLDRLKEENRKLRAELKEQGAKREQYAQLEKLNRELKEQIKAQELTVSDLESKIDYLAEHIVNLEPLAFPSMSHKDTILDIEDKHIRKHQIKREADSKRRSVHEYYEDEESFEELLAKIEEKLEQEIVATRHRHDRNLVDKVERLEKKLAEYQQEITKLTEKNKNLEATNESQRVLLEQHIGYSANLDDYTLDNYDTDLDDEWEYEDDFIKPAQKTKEQEQKRVIKPVLSPYKPF